MSVVDAWATEYGDMPPWGQGPAPSKLEKEGNAYIRRDFPNIDFWQECSVLPAEQVAAGEQNGRPSSSGTTDLSRSIDTPPQLTKTPRSDVFCSEHQEGDEHSSSGRRRRAHHDESEV
jgi:hypothetical protein